MWVCAERKDADEGTHTVFSFQADVLTVEFNLRFIIENILTIRSECFLLSFFSRKALVPQPIESSTRRHTSLSRLPLSSTRYKKHGSVSALIMLITL